MDVRLIACTDMGEEVCGVASGTCVSDRIPLLDDPRVNRSLSHALDAGHTSVAEHWSATFAISGISRACADQLLRHRHISADMQSMRYVKMDDPSFIVPAAICDLGLEDKYKACLDQCAQTYSELLKAGVPAEDARMVIPMSITTCLVLTANARELLHIFEQRTCNRAQAEIRELAEAMLVLCKEEAPTLFRTAGPPCMRGPCPEGKMSCKHPRRGEL